MLKRYKPFFKAGSMSFLAYRFQVFTWLIINFLQIACLAFLWIAVYKNSPDGMDSVINGFTFKEMIVYTVFVNIFSYVTLESTTLFEINEDIKKGTIDMAFTKPISYRIKFIFMALGNFYSCNLLFGVPLFIITYIIFVSVGYILITSAWQVILAVLFFLLAQIVANILQDTINYICGILCFYTSSGWGINQAKEVIVRFLSGGLLPLAFFPGWMATVVSYFPFAGLSYHPVLILMGKADTLISLHYVGFSITWLVLLNVFAKLLFGHASKRITVQGG